MNLAYLKILQRAWDRYSIDDLEGVSGPSTRVRAPRATVAQKVKHLTDFMTLNKAQGITAKEYENLVGISGNMGTYTRWLMAGRLNVEPGELLDFFKARWAANNIVKQEMAHAE